MPDVRVVSVNEVVPSVGEGRCETCGQFVDINAAVDYVDLEGKLPHERRLVCLPCSQDAQKRLFENH